MAIPGHAFGFGQDVDLAQIAAEEPVDESGLARVDLAGDDEQERCGETLLDGVIRQLRADLCLRLLAEHDDSTHHFYQLFARREIALTEHGGSREGGVDRVGLGSR